jgi:hypothetical protein
MCIHTGNVTSSGGNPLLHPIRDWRIWAICFGGMAAMIYGSRRVADAMSNQAFAYAYIALVAVFMWPALRWATRRVD